MLEKIDQIKGNIHSNIPCVYILIIQYNPYCTRNSVRKSFKAMVFSNDDSSLRRSEISSMLFFLARGTSLN